MGIFSNLFGSKPKPAEPGAVKSQLPEVEAALGRFVVDFHDRTKLQFILISPVLHKVAAKLFVEDVGPQVTINHYERMVKLMRDTIRQSHYRGCDWPEMSPHEEALSKELDAQLRQLSHEVKGKGVLNETIANALISHAMKITSQMDALVSAGFLITVLKELRDGVYNPPPEQRLEADKDTDEVTAVIFDQLRDCCYRMKGQTGLLWQHILPGLQRLCVTNCIKYQGNDGALRSFGAQVQQLATILDQCPKNPPQRVALPPKQVSVVTILNEHLEELVNSIYQNPKVHPAHVTIALSMLVKKLTIAHYDAMFLSALLNSSCTEIEQGIYASVKKTH